jgi:hypothetical protein
MKVEKSVSKAIDDWQQGQVESAMLHACNAIDGTAGKVYPNLGNKERFTHLLRENYDVFGPMAAPGIDLKSTAWPVKVNRPTAPGGKPDIADVIYSIHRCTHGHGDELPEGFELLSDAAGPTGITRLQVEKGKVRMSDRVIFGLLAVAVLSPENGDQKVPDSYYLTFGDEKLPINEWWGRKDKFPAIVAKVRLPQVKLDFGDWMNGL